ncbi:hypothetical protein [Fodinibius sp.]|uniref:hypothetical protein n=1 Tax=Fodinibius sp. TaxID=1872440 RepID=UPI002ACDDA48|nr:hypothetical protein [Fodinibius sp.]MDZ7660170.1 hypothetical protein [Fodinibius sp.]
MFLRHQHNTTLTKDSHLQSEAIALQSNASTEYNPSASKLGLQFGSGALFGAGGIFVGGFTGYAASGFEDDYSSLPGLFLGTAVGYLIGTSSGIYIAANSGPYNASFGYILLGNIVGTGIGVSGSLLAENAFDSDFSSAVSVGIALSSTIIGGMIANSMSIKKRTNQSSALLNFSKGHSQLAIPSIELSKTNHVNLKEMKVRNYYSPTVKLLNISL